MSERIERKSQRTMRRAGMAASLAGIATGAVLFGPNPTVIGDAAHRAFGDVTAVEHAVQDMAAKTYDTTVFVHCASTGKSKGSDTGGQASPLYHTIRLTPSVCATLGNIIANPSAIDPRDAHVVTAIEDTAHEVSHVNGAGLHKETDEGVTQCLAAQRSEQVAEAFGIPADQASMIGDSVAVAVQQPPRADYAVPAGCEAGGKYDVHAPGGHYPYDPVAAFVNGQ